MKGPLYLKVILFIFICLLLIVTCLVKARYTFAAACSNIGDDCVLPGGFDAYGYPIPCQACGCGDANCTCIAFGAVYPGGPLIYGNCYTGSCTPGACNQNMGTSCFVGGDGGCYRDGWNGCDSCFIGCDLPAGCSSSTPTPPPPPPPTVPNCSDISGPATLNTCQSGTYSADVTSPGSALVGGEINYWNGSINRILKEDFTPPGGTVTTSWTPMAAGTYSVCCRAWNDGVAECRPAIEGTPGPPVYTCAGPNSCLTVTVSQPTYTIQGRKIIIPGDQEIDPAKSQIATLPGYGTANSSPYWFNGVSTGDHTVSVSVPAGYSVVSTLCYDRIGCHTDACASGLPLCPPGDPRGCDASCGGGAVSQSGSSRTVTVPACGSNGYADLWWHYTSLSTCAVTLPATGTVDIGDTTDLTATATVTGGVGSITNITFSSGTTGVATVSPSSFSSSPATTTVSGLSAGTSTVTATATMTGGIVCTPASTLVTVPACTVTLTPGAPPNPTSMTVGQTQPFSATLTNIIPTNVTFSSNTGHVTLGPPGDTLPPSPYFTTGTAASIGSSILTASAKFGGVSKCQGTATVNVGSNPAWLQVKDGDVTTNSDLDSPVSPVATIPYFEDIGPGGYPGVPAYGGSTTLTQDNVSVNGWLAKSGYNATKVYNSAYFINAIPSNLVPAQIPQNSEPGSYFTSGGTLDSYGYSWYEYDAATAGPLLTINSNASLLARKVVLIVKGADVSLKGNITLTDGTGFFLLVTSGNITVDPGVGGGGSANLKGIYVADGIFDTGTNSGGGDLQLWVRGSVAAYGGFNLQRDLGVNNPTTPAELFEFAPDQELLFPTVLGVHSMNWQEVAP